MPRLTQRSRLGLPCAFWKLLPANTGAHGRGRRETSQTCLLASLRPPLLAGCACARGCVCEPVCAPCGPAGGVRQASSPVSGRRRRRCPQLPEAHRWLRGPSPRKAPPASICAPLSPQERQQPAPQAPAGGGAGAEPGRLGAGPAPGCGAVVLNGQLRAPQLPVRPPPQTGDAASASASLLSPARPGDPFASPAPLRADTFPNPAPIPWWQLLLSPSLLSGPN